MPEPDWHAALAPYRDHGWTYTRIGELYGRTYQTVSLHLRTLGAKRRLSPAWHSPESVGLYRLWTSMRKRCRDPEHPTFHAYGAKGVRVVSEWARYRPFYRLGDRERLPAREAPPDERPGGGLLAGELPMGRRPSAHARAKGPAAAEREGSPPSRLRRAEDRRRLAEDIGGIPVRRVGCAPDALDRECRNQSEMDTGPQLGVGRVASGYS